MSQDPLEQAWEPGAAHPCFVPSSSEGDDEHSRRGSPNAASAASTAPNRQHHTAAALSAADGRKIEQQQEQQQQREPQPQKQKKSCGTTATATLLAELQADCDAPRCMCRHDSAAPAMASEPAGTGRNASTTHSATAMTASSLEGGFSTAHTAAPASAAASNANSATASAIAERNRKRALARSSLAPLTHTAPPFSSTSDMAPPPPPPAVAQGRGEERGGVGNELKCVHSTVPGALAASPNASSKAPTSTRTHDDKSRGDFSSFVLSSPLSELVRGAASREDADAPFLNIPADFLRRAVPAATTVAAAAPFSSDGSRRDHPHASPKSTSTHFATATKSGASAVVPSSTLSSNADATWATRPYPGSLRSHSCKNTPVSTNTTSTVTTTTPTPLPESSPRSSPSPLSPSPLAARASGSTVKTTTVTTTDTAVGNAGRRPRTSPASLVDLASMMEASRAVAATLMIDPDAPRPHFPSSKTTTTAQTPSVTAAAARAAGEAGASTKGLVEPSTQLVTVTMPEATTDLHVQSSRRTEHKHKVEKNGDGSSGSSGSGSSPHMQQQQRDFSFAGRATDDDHQQQQHNLAEHPHSPLVPPVFSSSPSSNSTLSLADPHSSGDSAFNTSMAIPPVVFHVTAVPMAVSPTSQHAGSLTRSLTLPMPASSPALSVDHAVASTPTSRHLMGGMGGSASLPPQLPPPHLHGRLDRSSDSSGHNTGRSSTGSRGSNGTSNTVSTTSTSNHHHNVQHHTPFFGHLPHSPLSPGVAAWQHSRTFTSLPGSSPPHSVEARASSVHGQDPFERRLSTSSRVSPFLPSPHHHHHSSTQVPPQQQQQQQQLLSRSHSHTHFERVRAAPSTTSANSNGDVADAPFHFEDLLDNNTISSYDDETARDFTTATMTDMNDDEDDFDVEDDDDANGLSRHRSRLSYSQRGNSASWGTSRGTRSMASRTHTVATSGRRRRRRPRSSRTYGSDRGVEDVDFASNGHPSNSNSASHNQHTILSSANDGSLDVHGDDFATPQHQQQQVQDAPHSQQQQQQQQAHGLRSVDMPSFPFDGAAESPAGLHAAVTAASLVAAWRVRPFPSPRSSVASPPFTVDSASMSTSSQAYPLMPPTGVSTPSGSVAGGGNSTTGLPPLFGHSSTESATARLLHVTTATTSMSVSVGSATPHEVGGGTVMTLRGRSSHTPATATAMPARSNPPPSSSTAITAPATLTAEAAVPVPSGEKNPRFLSLCFEQPSGEEAEGSAMRAGVEVAADTHGGLLEGSLSSPGMPEVMPSMTPHSTTEPSSSMNRGSNSGSAGLVTTTTSEAAAQTTPQQQSQRQHAAHFGVSPMFDPHARRSEPSSAATGSSLDSLSVESHPQVGGLFQAVGAAVGGRPLHTGPWAAGSVLRPPPLKLARRSAVFSRTGSGGGGGAKPGEEAPPTTTTTTTTLTSTTTTTTTTTATSASSPQTTASSASLNSPSALRQAQAMREMSSAASAGATTTTTTTGGVLTVAEMRKATAAWAAHVPPLFPPPSQSAVSVPASAHGLAVSSSLTGTTLNTPAAAQKSSSALLMSVEPPTQVVTDAPLGPFDARQPTSTVAGEPDTVSATTLDSRAESRYLSSWRDRSAGEDTFLLSPSSPSSAVQRIQHQQQQQPLLRGEGLDIMVSPPSAATPAMAPQESALPSTTTTTMLPLTPAVNSRTVNDNNNNNNDGGKETKGSEVIVGVEEDKAEEGEDVDAAAQQLVKNATLSGFFSLDDAPRPLPQELSQKQQPSPPLASSMMVSSRSAEGVELSNPFGHQTRRCDEPEEGGGGAHKTSDDTDDDEKTAGVLWGIQKTENATRQDAHACGSHGRSLSGETSEGPFMPAALSRNLTRANANAAAVDRWYFRLLWILLPYGVFVVTLALGTFIATHVVAQGIVSHSWNELHTYMRGELVAYMEDVTLLPVMTGEILTSRRVKDAAHPVNTEPARPPALNISRALCAAIKFTDLLRAPVTITYASLSTTKSEDDVVYVPIVVKNASNYTRGRQAMLRKLPRDDAERLVRPAYIQDVAPSPLVPSDGDPRHPAGVVGSVATNDVEETAMKNDLRSVSATLQDPDPEVYTAFAFCDAGYSKNFFVTGSRDAVRLSQLHTTNPISTINAINASTLDVVHPLSKLTRAPTGFDGNTAARIAHVMPIVHAWKAAVARNDDSHWRVARWWISAEPFERPSIMYVHPYHEYGRTEPSYVSCRIDAEALLRGYVERQLKRTHAHAGAKVMLLIPRKTTPSDDPASSGVGAGLVRGVVTDIIARSWALDMESEARRTAATLVRRPRNSASPSTCANATREGKEEENARNTLGEAGAKVRDDQCGDTLANYCKALYKKVNYCLSRNVVVENSCGEQQADKETGEVYEDMNWMPWTFHDQVHEIPRMDNVGDALMQAALQAVDVPTYAAEMYARLDARFVAGTANDVPVPHDTHEHRDLNRSGSGFGSSVARHFQQDRDRRCHPHSGNATKLGDGRRTFMPTLFQEFFFEGQRAAVSVSAVHLRSNFSAMVVFVTPMAVGDVQMGREAPQRYVAATVVALVAVGVTYLVFLVLTNYLQRPLISIERQLERVVVLRTRRTAAAAVAAVVAAAAGTASEGGAAASATEGGTSAAPTLSAKAHGAENKGIQLSVMQRDGEEGREELPSTSPSPPPPSSPECGLPSAVATAAAENEESGSGATGGVLSRAGVQSVRCRFLSGARRLVYFLMQLRLSEVAELQDVCRELRQHVREMQLYVPENYNFEEATTATATTTGAVLAASSSAIHPIVVPSFPHNNEDLFTMDESAASSMPHPLPKPEPAHSNNNTKSNASVKRNSGSSSNGGVGASSHAVPASADVVQMHVVSANANAVAAVAAGEAGKSLRDARAFSDAAAPPSTEVSDSNFWGLSKSLSARHPQSTRSVEAAISGVTRREECVAPVTVVTDDHHEEATRDAFGVSLRDDDSRADQSLPEGVRRFSKSVAVSAHDDPLECEGGASAADSMTSVPLVEVAQTAHDAALEQSTTSSASTAATEHSSSGSGHVTHDRHTHGLLSAASTSQLPQVLHTLHTPAARLSRGPTRLSAASSTNSLLYAASAHASGRRHTRRTTANTTTVSASVTSSATSSRKHRHRDNAMDEITALLDEHRPRITSNAQGFTHSRFSKCLCTLLGIHVHIDDSYGVLEYFPEILETITACVHQYGGVFETFVPEMVYASFGSRARIKDHAVLAMRCGIEIFSRLSARALRYVSFIVDTGVYPVGVCGVPEHQGFVLWGRPSAELFFEQQYQSGFRFLVTDTVVPLVRHHFRLLPVDVVTIEKDPSTPSIVVYLVLVGSVDVPWWDEFSKLAHEAFLHLIRGDFEAACPLYDRLLHSQSVTFTIIFQYLLAHERVLTENKDGLSPVELARQLDELTVTCVNELEREKNPLVVPFGASMPWLAMKPEILGRFSDEDEEERENCRRQQTNSNDNNNNNSSSTAVAANAREGGSVASRSSEHEVAVSSLSSPCMRVSAVTQEEEQPTPLQDPGDDADAAWHRDTHPPSHDTHPPSHDSEEGEEVDEEDDRGSADVSSRPDESSRQQGSTRYTTPTTVSVVSVSTRGASTLASMSEQTQGTAKSGSTVSTTTTLIASSVADAAATVIVSPASALPTACNSISVPVVVSATPETTGTDGEASHRRNSAGCGSGDGGPFDSDGEAQRSREGHSTHLPLQPDAASASASASSAPTSLKSSDLAQKRQRSTSTSQTQRNADTAREDVRIATPPTHFDGIALRVVDWADTTWQLANAPIGRKTREGLRLTTAAAGVAPASARLDNALPFRAISSNGAMAEVWVYAVPVAPAVLSMHVPTTTTTTTTTNATARSRAGLAESTSATAATGAAAESTPLGMVMATAASSRSGSRRSSRRMSPCVTPRGESTPEEVSATTEKENEETVETLRASSVGAAPATPAEVPHPPKGRLSRLTAALTRVTGVVAGLDRFLAHAPTDESSSSCSSNSNNDVEAVKMDATSTRSPASGATIAAAVTGTGSSVAAPTQVDDAANGAAGARTVATSGENYSSPSSADAVASPSSGVLVDLDAMYTVARRYCQGNMVQLLSMAVTPTHVYSITEWVAGRTLHETVNRFGSRLALTSTRKCCVSLLRALDHLHSFRGVVHGRVHPDNILFGVEGTCKLTGMLYLYDWARPDPALHATLTRVAAAYCSPEVNAGAAPTAASDIYAFGLLLLQMLTGEVPWTWAGVTDTSSPRTSELQTLMLDDSVFVEAVAARVIELRQYGRHRNAYNAAVVVNEAAAVAVDHMGRPGKSTARNGAAAAFSDASCSNDDTDVEAESEGDPAMLQVLESCLCHAPAERKSASELLQMLSEM